MEKRAQNSSILDFLHQHQGTLDNIIQFLSDNGINYGDRFDSDKYIITKNNNSFVSNAPTFVTGQTKTKGSFSLSFNKSFDITNI